MDGKASISYQVLIILNTLDSQQFIFKTDDCANCLFCGSFCDLGAPATDSECTGVSLTGQYCYVCDYDNKYTAALTHTRGCKILDNSADKINRMLVTPFIDNTKLITLGDFTTYHIIFEVDSHPNPATYSFFVKILGFDYPLTTINHSTANYDHSNTVEVFAFGKKLRLFYYNDKTKTNYDSLELTLIPTSGTNTILARVTNFSQYFGNYCHIGLSYEYDATKVYFPAKMNFEVQGVRIPLLVSDPNLYPSSSIDFSQLAISNRVFGLWGHMIIYNNYFIGIFAHITHNYTTSPLVIADNNHKILPINVTNIGDDCLLNSKLQYNNAPAPAPIMDEEYFCFNEFDNLLDIKTYADTSTMQITMNTAVTGSTKKIVPDKNKADTVPLSACIYNLFILGTAASIGIGTGSFIYTNCLEMCDGPDSAEYCACNTGRSNGNWLVKDIDGVTKCRSKFFN